MGGFEVKSNIALTVTDCIASFEAIGEVERERLCHSHATVSSWNGEMCGRILQAKSWVPSSLARHRLYRERGQWQASFIREKLACLMYGAYVFYGNFQKPSLSRWKQCVPGSLFFTHPQEPENDANKIHEKDIHVQPSCGCFHFLCNFTCSPLLSQNVHFLNANAT